ncbi:MAG TPA: transglycosylase SLT domain-containing protein [Bacillota bacterium]|nr:transglycosylase SLT domain-containing protein [Bacillota bacterium]
MSTFERGAAIFAIIVWAAAGAAAANRSAAPAPVAVLAVAGPHVPTAADLLAARVGEIRPAAPQAQRAAIATAILQGAAATRTDPRLLFAVIQVESGFDPTAVGTHGEIGLMQVLPSTAAAVARGIIRGPAPPAASLFQPGWNVRVGATYLAVQEARFRGNLAMALSAYNAGGGVTAPTPYAAQVLAAYAAARSQ